MGETTQGRTGKWAKRPGGETTRGERESGRNDSGANRKVGETTRIHYKSMGVFFRRSRADNSVVGGPIWPKFELVRGITYKFKMDLINSDREKVATSIFFRRSRAANSVVSSGIWPKFELIQALMYVLVTCKYEKDRIKNNRKNVETPFSPLYVYGDFFSDAQGPLTP